MWDDEPSPWGDDDTPAEGGEAAPAAEGDAPAAAAAGAPAAGKPGAAAAAEPKFEWRGLPKADPPKYTYHWVRPLVLNYGYIYDYRQNYYNDVIDYMNKRNKGLTREEPRAEEWSERAIRMYDSKNITNRSYKRCSDMGILMGYKPKVRHYSYHTRAYYSLKYQKVL